MDRDTAEEIKRHFDTIASGLRSEIRAVGDGLVVTSQRQDRTAKALDERIVQTGKTLDERIDRTNEKLDRLDEKLDRGFEEVKRHFEVVAEGLGSQIRVVAEGLVAINKRLDRFEVSFSDRFGEMESLMRLSFSELDRRIQTLASR